MSAERRDLRILRQLAATPFIDRLELAAISGTSDRSAYDAVAVLESRGWASSVTHATDLLRSTRRFFLTSAGVRSIASLGDVDLDRILRMYPVSARWRRILMERLDAVAVVYRLSSFMAAEQGPVALRWYRAAPLDAAIELPDGRALGVLRQGRTSDRTGFSKRLRRLREGPLPGAVLLLMPDEVRLRYARRLLKESPIRALLALEQDAALAGPEDPVWRLPSVAATLDLRHVISYVECGGALPAEPEPLRAALPENIEIEGPGQKIPDWLLPSALKPAEKRVLDLIFDWPGIAPRHLRGVLGVSSARLYEVVGRLTEAGLVLRVSAGNRRLALADRGLALLARRDRTSVGGARKRWSVEPIEPEASEGWRNVSGRRSRQLLRNVEHTAAVHAFIAALAEQARSMGWEIAQLDPPFRASRHFPYGPLPARAGGTRSVHPDAFGALRRGTVTLPFFLEWERRAVRPASMARRLAPYLRYYSTRRPIDDHGATPIVLVVFQDMLAATHFLRVAREEMDRAGVEVPLLVSHEAALDSLGPLGRVWREPGDWGTVHALPRSRERSQHGG
ncbi:MAG: replication-relaxation family protein [Gemmatimonadota bacterium]|nr:replication-relaxation family protein [Gemmatimonadota bacterium]